MTRRPDRLAEIDAARARQTPLPDPDATPRPASGVGPHGDHFDPFYYVADPSGWGWCRVSAVNFPTVERAQAWIDEHEAKP